MTPSNVDEFLHYYNSIIPRILIGNLTFDEGMKLIELRRIELRKDDA